MTNDDGVQSAGIMELSMALPDDWRITIVAPEREQSAQSHALTIQTPLKIIKQPPPKGNITVYAITGTPVDCVKMALDYMLENDMPDLLISGINNGYNLGSDVLYSGTVSAAMEGLFYDIPALALSVKHYSTARGLEMFPFIISFIRKVFVDKEFNGLVNMNFPLVGDCDWSHVRVVEQGRQKYRNIVEKQSNKRGQTYYWIGGEIHFDENAEEMTDVGTVEDGFVTVSALTWKQFDSKSTDELRCIISQ